MTLSPTAKEFCPVYNEVTSASSKVLDDEAPKHNVHQKKSRPPLSLPANPPVLLSRGGVPAGDLYQPGLSATGQAVKKPTYIHFFKPRHSGH